MKQNKKNEDFIDEIHRIREESYERRKHMTTAEMLEDINKGASLFRKELEEYKQHKQLEQERELSKKRTQRA